MMNHARNWPEPKKKKAVMKRNQVAPEPKKKVTTTQLLEMMKGDSFRRHREEQLVNDGAERLFRKDFSWGEELLKSGLTPATKQRIYHKSRELELEEKKKKALLSLVTNRPVVKKAREDALIQDAIKKLSAPNLTPKRVHDISDQVHRSTLSNAQHQEIADGIVANALDEIAPIYHKGGVIKRTGVIKAQKGEIIVPKSRVASVVKAVKKAGLKPLKL